MILIIQIIKNKISVFFFSLMDYYLYLWTRFCIKSD